MNVILAAAAAVCNLLVAGNRGRQGEKNFRCFSEGQLAAAARRRYLDRASDAGRERVHVQSFSLSLLLCPEMCSPNPDRRTDSLFYGHIFVTVFWRADVSVRL